MLVHSATLRAEPIAAPEAVAWRCGPQGMARRAKRALPAVQAHRTALRARTLAIAPSWSALVQPARSGQLLYCSLYKSLLPHVHACLHSSPAFPLTLTQLDHSALAYYVPALPIAAASHSRTLVI